MIWGRSTSGPMPVGVANAELLGYFAVSLIALAVDLGIFSISIRIADLPWFVAATLGFLAGVIVAHRLSVAWVFSHRRLHARPKLEFAAFAGIGVMGLGLTQAILWIGIERQHLIPEFVRVVAAGATFLFNFAVRKTMLFAIERGKDY